MRTTIPSRRSSGRVQGGGVQADVGDNLTSPSAAGMNGVVYPPAIF